MANTRSFITRSTEDVQGGAGYQVHGSHANLWFRISGSSVCEHLSNQATGGLLPYYIFKDCAEKMSGT